MPIIAESYIIALASFSSMAFVLFLFGKKIHGLISSNKMTMLNSIDKSEKVLKNAQDVLVKLQKELEDSRNEYDAGLKKVSQNIKHMTEKASSESEELMKKRIQDTERIAQDLKSDLLREIKKGMISGSVSTSKAYLSRDYENNQDSEEHSTEYGKHIVNEINEAGTRSETEKN